MTQVVELILPLVILLLAGFVLHWRRLASDLLADGMTRYLNNIAIPVLLFDLVAGFGGEHAVEHAGEFLLAYFGAVVLVWTLASAAAYFVHRNTLAATINGESAVFSNTVMLGLPLIFTFVPASGQGAIAPLLAVHLPVMTAITLVLCEWSISWGKIHWARIGRKVVQRLLRNPIIGGLIAGLIFRSLGLELHASLETATGYIKDSVVGIGLLLLGMNMHSQAQFSRKTWLRTTETIAIISIAKLFIFPATVLLITTQVFALPPYWVWCAVIFAACPTGVTPWLHANLYACEIGTTSSAISVTILLSIFSIPLFLVHLAGAAPQ